jgi:hypothetical protein
MTPTPFGYVTGSLSNAEVATDTKFIAKDGPLVTAREATDDGVRRSRAKRQSRMELRRTPLLPTTSDE